MRRPSGHRRYPSSSVYRLKLIQSAVEQGLRPSKAIPMSLTDLLQFLGKATSSSSALSEVAKGETPQPKAAHPWVPFIRNLDGAQLERALQLELSGSSLLAVIEQKILPFLREVGELWQAGELTIGHEHFASARLSSFLSKQWQSLSDTARGSRVVCAALPEEKHTLPLHLAAWVMASTGCRILFLGANTPIYEIANLAEQGDAAAILTAPFPGHSPLEFHQPIRELRNAVSLHRKILVGTPSALEIPGVETVSSFRSLQAISEQL